MLASRVRVLGSGRSQKNDPNDARSVAIAALRSDRLGRVRPDDRARVLRLLAKRHRDMAQLRNKHCTRLHALLGELAAGGIGSELTVSKANAVLDTVEVDSEVTRHRVLIGTELVDDIARLDNMLKASKKRVEQGVSASGTTLTSIVGIGPINAATVIGYSGDIDRFAAKAQFASCNGTAPSEASSSGRVRHGRTCAAAARSTTLSTSQRSVSCATTARAAPSTTAKLAEGNRPKKRSGR